MPNTGDKFVTTLKKAHLEWGSHRHTNSRCISYGEGYLHIPADYAYTFEITNDKSSARPQTYDFKTADGFIQDGRLKASGNQYQEKYAKQFHGEGDLQILGDWFKHLGLTEGDQVEIRFVSPSEILLTKI